MHLFVFYSSIALVEFLFVDKEGYLPQLFLHKRLDRYKYNP